MRGNHPHHPKSGAVRVSKALFCHINSHIMTLLHCRSDHWLIKCLLRLAVTLDWWWSLLLVCTYIVLVVLTPLAWFMLMLSLCFGSKGLAHTGKLTISSALLLIFHLLSQKWQSVSQQWNPIRDLLLFLSFLFLAMNVADCWQEWWECAFLKLSHTHTLTVSQTELWASLEIKSRDEKFGVERLSKDQQRRLLTSSHM